MINGPSKHISWIELACKDGTPYPIEWKTNRAIQLAEAFEQLRRDCGNTPIQILSAFRTPKHNKHIGGARNSQHVQGRALDMRHSILSVDELYDKVKELSLITAIRGIGKYNTFVHMDIRPSEKTIFWSGTGKKDS